MEGNSRPRRGARGPGEHEPARRGGEGLENVSSLHGALLSAMVKEQLAKTSVFPPGPAATREDGHLHGRHRPYLAFFERRALSRLG